MFSKQRLATFPSSTKKGPEQPRARDPERERERERDRETEKNPKLAEFGDRLFLKPRKTIRASPMVLSRTKTARRQTSPNTAFRRSFHRIQLSSLRFACSQRRTWMPRSSVNSNSCRSCRCAAGSFNPKLRQPGVSCQVDELKAELRKLRLPLHGKKAALLERLAAHTSKLELPEQNEDSDMGVSVLQNAVVEDQVSSPNQALKLMPTAPNGIPARTWRQSRTVLTKDETLRRSLRSQRSCQTTTRSRRRGTRPSPEYLDPTEKGKQEVHNRTPAHVRALDKGQQLLSEHEDHLKPKRGGKQEKGCKLPKPAACDRRDPEWLQSIQQGMVIPKGCI